MRRVMRVLSGIVTAALMTVIVLLAGLLITSKMSDEPGKSIHGYKGLTVLSGSMEPNIHVGDMIVVRTADPDALQVNDVITFQTAEDANMLITHRLVGILTMGGQRFFQTKGDANDSPDGQLVAPNRVVGHLVFRVPYFGYVKEFVHKPLGFVLLVVLPGLALIVGEIMKMLKALSAEEAQKAAQAAPATPSPPAAAPPQAPPAQPVTRAGEMAPGIPTKATPVPRPATPATKQPGEADPFDDCES